jgi:hypothetical protein
MMAMTTPGQAISYTTGRVTITVQYVRSGAYTVTVYQGTLRLDEQCGAYSTETEARAIARLYAQIHRAETAAALALAA